MIYENLKQLAEEAIARISSEKDEIKISVIRARVKTLNDKLAILNVEKENLDKKIKEINDEQEKIKNGDETLLTELLKKKDENNIQQCFIGIDWGKTCTKNNIPNYPDFYDEFNKAINDYRKNIS